jgi:hypothetical protein
MLANPFHDLHGEAAADFAGGDGAGRCGGFASGWMLGAGGGVPQRVFQTPQALARHFQRASGQ